MDTIEPPPVDTRYAEAVQRQIEARRQLVLTQRRRPILRIVGGTDVDPPASH